MIVDTFKNSRSIDKVFLTKAIPIKNIGWNVELQMVLNTLVVYQKTVFLKTVSCCVSINLFNLIENPPGF